ncbi:MAG: ATP-binding protein, partial [Thermodesulfobacteria bacterium]|nr:ATP-binding protein [Thermodesulfobacteriota bacterium]
VESYASAIIYQCERLEELLEALERFVMLPAPRFKLVQVGEIVDLLREKFRLELSGEPPELRIISSSRSELVAFYTDPSLLLEAINEMVKNAFEAHQAKAVNKPVELRVRVKGETVTFDVSDFGEGINIETLPFIFNPFFSTKPGHLGMGLTLASRIAEELDGKIEVTHLHQPTTVSLRLPLDRRRPERRKLLTEDHSP